MRLPVLGESGDARLARTVAFTFVATVTILALYFGRQVLIPVAVAVLFAFILNPVVNGLRRLLPLPLAVTLALLGAISCLGVLAVLAMTQLAEVAGSLAGYQTNLHQKIRDVRQLSEGAGPVSRFLAMTAAVAQDLSPDASNTAPSVRVQSSDFESLVHRELRSAAGPSAAVDRHRHHPRRVHPAGSRQAQRQVRAPVRRRRACHVAGRRRRRGANRAHAGAAAPDQHRFRGPGRARPLRARHAQRAAVGTAWPEHCDSCPMSAPSWARCCRP